MISVRPCRSQTSRRPFPHWGGAAEHQRRLRGAARLAQRSLTSVRLAHGERMLHRRALEIHRHDGGTPAAGAAPSARGAECSATVHTLRRAGVKETLDQPSPI